MDCIVEGEGNLCGKTDSGNSNTNDGNFDFPEHSVLPKYTSTILREHPLRYSRS